MKRIVPFILVCFGLAARGEDALRTVVLANRNVPESLALAAEYAKFRNIPERHVVALDLPATETISRGFYELRLRDPLLEALRATGLIRQTRRGERDVRPHETAWTTVESSLRYVVCMYGVPLRIADTRTWLLPKVAQRLDIPFQPDGAAVDSELSLLLAETYGIAGRVANPWYNMARWDDASPGGRRVLIAARLDGPDAATVRRMMAGVEQGEKYGLSGRVYVDARARHDDDYTVGDHWLNRAAERFAQEGFECVVDRGDGIWTERFPMESAAVYLGWYKEHVTGPMALDAFRFSAGAFAYHIHSGSARSLRTSTQHWVGPLLSRGAAATMGAVDEPFLGYTPDLGIFSDRWCSGHTFGESAYMALPALSWHITVVGDPLYAPFKLSLDDQTRNLERDGHADVDWAHLRKINLMVREGRFNVALNYCRAKIAARDSLVLRERLGDLYAMNDLFDVAVAQYDSVVNGAATAQTAVRAGARYLLMLRIAGQVSKANEVEKAIRARWAGSPFLQWLDGAHP